MSEHSFSSAWRAQSLGRRLFLRVSAASAATVGLVAAGCSTTTPQPVKADPFQLALPTSGLGLLYYAYLLAVAQATTYQKVLDAPPADLTLAERAIFSDLRDHEVIYRELLKRTINPAGTTALFPADFAFALTPFTLTTRAGVLAAALQLEDLVAAAYPVLLSLFFAEANLLPAQRTVLLAQRALLLKTSSVHARHAATVRDLIAPGSFANDDVVTSTGLLAGQVRTKTPKEVVAALAPFFAPYVINVVNLPTPA